MSPKFAQEFAEFMGPEYTKGSAEVDSIKPNVRFVDKDGSVKQLKGNLINVEVVKGIKGYDRLYEQLLSGEIDLIIPASVAKLGYVPEGTILDEDLSESTIHTISGDKFLSVEFKLQQRSQCKNVANSK